METLILTSNRKISGVSMNFTRYGLRTFDWNNRLIAIRGSRGVGKTTMLLQHAASALPGNGSTMYVAMDDLFFMKNNLYKLAEDFEKLNGKYLLLDEVHKYPGWSREIKLIYDNLPNLNVIFTSSSILEIYRSESDLSRRAVSYDLHELSFREFIEFTLGISLPVLTLDDILHNHEAIARDICGKIKPIYEFDKYIRYGNYPYFMENIDSYYGKLNQTINLILEVDLPTVERVDYNHIAKIKRLLYVLGTSVPFSPNISKLSEATGMSRAALVKALEYLEKAHLIMQLHSGKKGDSQLAKPDKIYMRNTNCIYSVVEENANVGNLRETFFLNQLQTIHSVKMADKGDFLVNDTYVFEVGGKGKTTKQIFGVENAFVVKDNIEVGVFNTIPLWLFGFLY